MQNDTQVFRNRFFFSLSGKEIFLAFVSKTATSLNLQKVLMFSCSDLSRDHVGDFDLSPIKVQGKSHTTIPLTPFRARPDLGLTTPGLHS